MKEIDNVPIAPVLIDDNKDNTSEDLSEKPIGKWKQLLDSLEDKSWGKRYKAFEDLNMALNEEDSELLSLISNKWVIYLSEANMKVQEKMCNAFNNYIEKKKVFSKELIIEIVQVLICRCISSNLQPIKIIGLNASIKLSDKLPDVNPIIQIAVENIETIKKCQVASVQLINGLLGACSTKVSIKPLFPMFETLLRSSSNSILKKEVINFYKLAYQNMGNAMLSYLSSLPTTLLEEVNKAILLITCTIENSPTSNNKLNEYTVCDSFWCEKYNSLSGWKEKKAYLEESHNRLLQGYKIKPPLHKLFLELVKKLLESEPCLAVVQLIIKILSIVGELLKEEMNGWKSFIIQLLLKYKEKKLEEDITQCLQRMKCIKLGQITTQICDIMTKEKLKVNPNVKRCTAIWIGKSMVAEAHNLKNSEIMMLSEIMIGLADDGLPEVRESALKALGIIKATTKAKIDALINDLSPSKKEIIMKSAADTIHVKVITTTPPKNVEAQLPNEFSFDKIELNSDSMVEQEIDNNILIEMHSQNEEIQLIGLNKFVSAIQIKLKSDLERNAILYENFILYVMKVHINKNSFKVADIAIRCITSVIKGVDITQKIDKPVLSYIIPQRSKELDTIIDEAILTLTDLHGPEAIMTILIAISARTPSIVKRSDILTISLLLLNQYPIKLFPVKAIIDISKKSLYGDNQQLAGNVLAIIFSYIGLPLLGYFYDLNEAQLAKLQIEFQKVDYPSALTFKRTLRGEAAKQNAIYVLNIIDKVLPRVDIVAKVTPYLEQLHSPLSKIKLDALGKIKVIVVEACFRINCANLVDLIKGISSCMNDIDDNVKIEGLNTIRLLIKSVGPKIKIYSIQILSSLICTLACNIKSVTAETHKCLTLYSEIAGGDSVINHLSTTLLKGCKELREEALRWLYQENSGYVSCEHKLLIPGILSCLQDASEEIREMSEKIIPKVIPYVGKNAFASFMRDLNPTVQETLKGILSKYSDITNVIGQDTHNNNELSAKKEGSSISIDLSEHIKQITSMLKINDQQKHTEIANESPKIPLSMLNEGYIESSNLMGAEEISPPFKKLAIRNVKLQNVNSKTKLTTPKVKINMNLVKVANAKVVPNQKSERGMHSLLNRNDHSSSFTFKARPASYASVSPTKDDDIRSSLYYKCYIPIVMMSKNKETRLTNQKNTWPMLEAKSAYIELLKKELKPMINAILFRDMFASDFKVHINCITAISLSLNSEFNEIVSILDLILRWFASGFIDNNTGVNKCVVDFLSNLFALLEANKYLLYDIEIELMIPLAIKLMSTTNSYIKVKSREIIFEATKLADPQFVTPFLIRVLKQKNSKSKVECIDIVTELLQNNGSSIISDKDANLIAVSLSTKEAALKFTLLNAILEIYNCEGIKIWNRIAPISDAIKKEIEQKCAEGMKEVNESKGGTENHASLISGSSNKKLNEIPSANPSNESSPSQLSKTPTIALYAKAGIDPKSKYPHSQMKTVSSYDIKLIKHSQSKSKLVTKKHQPHPTITQIHLLCLLKEIQMHITK